MDIIALKKSRRIMSAIFIAWGILTWVVVVIDMTFFHLGLNIFDLRDSLSQGHAVSLNLSIALSFFSSPAILSTIFWGLLKVAPFDICILFAFVAQIVFYWYCGSLAGRTFIWYFSDAPDINECETPINKVSHRGKLDEQEKYSLHFEMK